MPPSSVPVSVESNPDTPSCDCLAHVYGNAVDHGERVRHYSSDMADQEWAQVRAAMPVPGWLESRGGQPEATATDRSQRVPRPAAGEDPYCGRPGPGADRSFDGGKKINGRKRHIVVDTAGLLLAVMVTAANVTDREAAQVLLARLTERFFLLKLVWADGGYTGPLADFAAKALRLALTVVKRDVTCRVSWCCPAGGWLERTFGWLMRSRRLTRGYERRTETAEAMVLWSMTMVMSRRLAKQRCEGARGVSASQPRTARRFAWTARAEPRTREPPPDREVREHRSRPAHPAASYEGAFPARLCCRTRRLMPRAGTATPIRTGTPAAIPTQRTSAR